MMKNLVKTVAVVAIACVVALKAYDKQNVNVSDVILVNVEALASDLEVDFPPIGVTCSKNCNDGRGRCWKPRSNQPDDCERSPYQENKCVCK